MDALSDVLNTVRLEGAVYLDAEFAAPWCLSAKFGLDKAREWLPGCDHVIYFHYIAEGACRVKRAAGGDPIEVAAGDLVIFPQDDDHVMGSDLQRTPAATAGWVMRDARDGGALNVMQVGGSGPRTRFVCGYLACSRSAVRPLIEALPRVIHVPVGDGEGSGLLRELLRAGVRGSGQDTPGASTAVAKVAELLFVEALRRYLATLPPTERGWIAALRDPHVGRAMALLHAAPARDWTVEALAREVALSRSALAERFTALAGEPPMQYLTRWRLALAARSLREGNEHVGRIAERSGYESEAAFTRAFKREFGVPPRVWRKNGTG